MAEKKKKGIDSTAVLLFILLVGVCFLLYPTVADYWNSFHQSRAIASYVEKVNSIDNTEFERLWQEATAYNRALNEKNNRYAITEEEEAEYNRILDISGTGIMAYIEIPKIKVQLPIYHGTEESVLQVAIGHIEGTSLPVGGETTHCVISGHRGLPSAKLFSDIDKLERGDVFTIETLGETLTYEVDQIRIVLPHELDDIEIVEGKDYVTLVTCTPYGINTHRLLVRAHRIANAREHIRVTADAVQIDSRLVALGLGIIMTLLFVLYLIIKGFIKH